METRERIARCKSCGERIKTSSDDPICPECYYGKKTMIKGANVPLVNVTNSADAY